MKIYPMRIDGHEGPITDFTASQIRRVMSNGRWDPHMIGGDSNTSPQQWDEQALIVLSLKDQGLI